MSSQFLSSQAILFDYGDQSLYGPFKRIASDAFSFSAAIFLSDEIIGKCVLLCILSSLWTLLGPPLMVARPGLRTRQTQLHSLLLVGGLVGPPAAQHNTGDGDSRHYGCVAVI